LDILLGLDLPEDLVELSPLGFERGQQRLDLDFKPDLGQERIIDGLAADGEMTLHRAVSAGADALRTARAAHGLATGGLRAHLISLSLERRVIVERDSLGLLRPRHAPL